MERAGIVQALSEPDGPKEHYLLYCALDPNRFYNLFERSLGGIVFTPSYWPRIGPKISLEQVVKEAPRSIRCDSLTGFDQYPGLRVSQGVKGGSMIVVVVVWSFFRRWRTLV